VSWRALLDGDRRATAHRRVVEIAEAMPASLDHHDFPGLAGGLGGIAMFYQYCDLAFPSCGYDATAGALLERTVGKAIDLHVGLFGGYAGIGWLCDHMGASDDVVDSNARFDDVIAGVLVGDAWRGDFDLINGLVGLGVYGLGREHRGRGREIVDRVIAQLAARTVSRDGGIAWHTSPLSLPESRRRDHPDGYFDLGVAHGIPGVVGFLARAEIAGHASARPLIDPALDFLNARAQSGSDARYGAFVTDAVVDPPTRSAWCYGDPGVAVASIAAGLAGRPAAIERGIALARGVARREPRRVDCRDAGLCHGSAGLGHILNRIANVTGDAELAAAATRWFDEVLAFRADDGIAGFGEAPPLDDNLEWESSVGLLTGAAGTGLALLAASTDIDPDWDRLLLLDIDQ
jgi:hypothetical protein